MGPLVSASSGLHRVSRRDPLRTADAVDRTLGAVLVRCRLFALHYKSRLPIGTDPLAPEPPITAVVAPATTCANKASLGKERLHPALKMSEDKR